jgi:hypothetical protein
MELNQISKLLEKKLKKHHLHKLKFAYSDNKTIVFYCKHKIERTRIFDFELNEATQKKYGINSQNITIYKFNRHMKLYKSGDLSDNLHIQNLGSPKITIDLEKNTYKISMFHIISHYANKNYYTNNSMYDRFQEYYEDIFNKKDVCGLYHFESIYYNL